MMLMQAMDFLAAAPFLPHGRGALILILGGLAALPFGLLWSRVSPGAQRWTIGLEQRAALEGLGPCHVDETSLRSCMVTLKSCPSCRSGTRAATCLREQELLRLAIRPRAPGARVVEVGHGLSRHGACTFLIFRGS